MNRTGMKQVHNRMRALLLGALLSIGSVSPGLSHAQVNFANVPLFLTTSVEPNVLFILDDSGSMMWEILPDEAVFQFGTAACDWVKWVFPRINNLHGGGDYCGNSRTVRFQNDLLGAQMRTSSINSMYYDPAVTYRPWVDANGDELPPAPRDAAPNRPLFPAFGTRDLTDWNSWSGRWWNADGTVTNTDIDFFPATYYYLPEGADDTDLTSFIEVQIKPTNAPFTGQGREDRTDCASAPSCTYDEEIQNFANWYSYHRNRVFTSRGGIGRAFSGFDGGMRVGFGAINHNRTSTSDLDGVAGRTVVRGVRPFTGTDKEAFFQELYHRPIPTDGTPLRRALEGAGEYYSRIDERGPWSSSPGQSGGVDYECRQSYSILMTDGYTTGDTGSSGTAGGYGATGSPRRDNTDGTTDHNTINVNPDPSGSDYVYTPADPYQDGWSHTLADVAMYYWKRDLRDDLPNRVPTSPRNEAFWQHMVTYGIGLGVAGNIDPADAWQAVEDGTPINWPDPRWEYVNCGQDPTEAACPARIDDLLHAAINSRGGFFSVMDAEAFADELSAVLDDIIGRVEDSATSAAASAAVIQADTLLYLAGFRSGDWTGELKAFQIEGDGTVGALAWDAEAQLATMTPLMRNLYTLNSATGDAEALEFLLLSPAQQAALSHATDGSLDNLGNDRIDWLRGESVAGFRSRTTPLGESRLLGDIVHSSPQFVGRPNLGYSMLPGTEGSSYSAFRSTTPYSSRPSAIYVGANDGMLHAFHGTTGDELFAYMPSALLLPESGNAYARINRLMDPDYAHRYFVDGAATVGDAYVNGSWKTILIGTMGAGGRTVFALDVTDPENFDDTKVLWEFTHPGLGYGVTNPSIVRMRNGQWAAVFGNGYNSDNHTAGLFIVPIGNPSSYVFVNTGVGDSTTPNGLAPVVVTDAPSGDLNARLIYAGDLQGRMWRFDVSSTNPNQWNNAGNRTVLFQARDASDVPQPITARAKVTAHPTEQGTLMVLFGTGSYFRTQDGDLTDPQIQSLYGLKDQNGAAIASRNDLVEQEIVWQGDHTFSTSDGDVTYTLRQVSEEPVTSADKGWYLDLVYASNNQGERVISEPTFPSGPVSDRVRFATMIPDEDPCGTGRRGFLMDIMVATGGTVPYTVFDLNQDGYFDSGDYVNNMPVSGVGFGGGEKPTTVLNPDTGIDHIFGGQGDDLRGLPGGQPSGRQSWRQLR